MTKNRYHLFAAIGLAVLSTACFGLFIWALVDGAVIQSTPGSRIKGSIDSHSYTKIYTREDDPGVYWKVVGAFGFFGTLFTIVAVFEHRTYRIYRGVQKDETPSRDLLAKIDHACRLFPEGRETLLRAKAAVVDLNDAAVEIALRRLLEKVMRTPDRAMALEEIENLAKALNLVGKL